MLLEGVCYYSTPGKSTRQTISSYVASYGGLECTFSLEIAKLPRGRGNFRKDICGPRFVPPEFVGFLLSLCVPVLIVAL